MKIKKPICKGCGKEIINSNSTLQKYCGPWCLRLDPNYKQKKVKPYIHKPIKKHKKNPLNASLDSLWSKAVKVLANDKCEHCGSSSNLNSHHVYGRKNFSVRWEVKNGICLCPSCHQFSTIFSAHSTPSKFTDWTKEYRGIDWYDKLEVMALQNRDKPDKERLLIELKEIIYGKDKKLPF